MDCDLQDMPEEISKLYNEALKGFDIVFARRHQRVDSFLKKLTNILFYKVFTYLSGIKQDRTISNFGIFNKRVIQEINKIREPMRGFSQMARWVGFQKSYVDVTHGQRFEGKSTYSFAKLINLGLDIAIAYTDKPLRIVVNTGILVSCFSLFFVIYCFIAYFSGWLTVPGYASIIASIWLLSGLIILMLGVVGIYIGKIFEGVKNRPLYIIEKASNLNR